MDPLSVDEMNHEFNRKKAMLIYMEFRIEELIEKELRISSGIEVTRRRLMKGIQNMLSRGHFDTDIGIKKMGEVDGKVFLGPCKERFGAFIGPLKAAELTSLWQKNVKKSSWVPFLISGHTESVDEEDPKLLCLKEEWGDEAYKAVIVALEEILVYNPFQRTVVDEIWNFKENRKAALNEIIDCMLRVSRHICTTSARERAEVNA